MKYVQWKRVPRAGIIPSHWVGTTSTGKALFRIENRIGGSRARKTVTTIMWRLPSGGSDVFSSVRVAKAAGDNLARLANFTPFEEEIQG